MTPEAGLSADLASCDAVVTGLKKFYLAAAE